MLVLRCNVALSSSVLETFWFAELLGKTVQVMKKTCTTFLKKLIRAFFLEPVTKTRGPLVINARLCGRCQSIFGQYRMKMKAAHTDLDTCKNEQRILFANTVGMEGARIAMQGHVVFVESCRTFSTVYLFCGKDLTRMSLF